MSQRHWVTIHHSAISRLASGCHYFQTLTRLTEVGGPFSQDFNEERWWLPWNDDERSMARRPLFPVKERILKIFCFFWASLPTRLFVCKAQAAARFGIVQPIFSELKGTDPTLSSNRELASSTKKSDLWQKTFNYRGHSIREPRYILYSGENCTIPNSSSRFVVKSVGSYTFIGLNPIVLLTQHTFSTLSHIDQVTLASTASLLPCCP